LVALTNVPPYAATLSGVATGTHTLVARATDDRAGVAASAPVTITVGAPNSLPVVSLTAPAAGSAFIAPAAIVLAAAATDPDGTVTKVEFFHGATLIGSVAAPPYMVTWPNVAAGSYALTAKATDNVGASATSAPVAISVTTNQAPTVSITSPVEGASFAAPASIALAATATDPDGTVARVDFFHGATLLGSASTPPYGIGWTDVAPGSYSITARATDDRGAVAVSSAVNLSVTGSVLAIDAPTDGAAIDGDTLTVSGTLQAPPNSGVTVNGVIAAISGNRFHANGVALNAGANVLTATLTTLDGETAAHAINVTSTGFAPVKISAGPTQGLAPLSVVFDVLPQDGVTIQEVEIDADGDGNVDQTLTAPPWTTNLTYSGAGTVAPVVRVTHGAGTTALSIPVVIANETQLDQTLRQVWSGMTNALAAGDKALAMRYLDAAARERYGPVFDLLLPVMPQIVTTFSELQPVTLSDALGEYAVNRTIDGENLLFLIYFGRSGDGVWRLGAM
jgi:hypothetical protein